MNSMNKIAIMGAGSLGSIMGAYIAKHRQIDLIDVNKEHVDAMNKTGAQVVGKVDMTVPVTALLPDDMEGNYDLIFLMVKQLYTESALESLKSHMHEETIICTLQNGFPELDLIKQFGDDKIVGCTVDWGATWIKPGVSELTSDSQHMGFTIGRLDGKVTSELNKVKEILELMCPVEVTTDLKEARWTKLMSNAGLSGMSATLGCTFGDILDDKRGFIYLQHLLNEIIKVGQGMGIEKLRHGNLDAVPLFRFNSLLKQKFSGLICKKAYKPHRLLKASMLQDLEKGRPCEIDAINGVVSEQGRLNNVPTPFCDKIIEVVKKIETGEAKPCMENLNMLMPVLDAKS